MRADPWARVTDTCRFEDLQVDMRSANWFDADMCPAFGAILYRLGRDLDTVHLTHIPTPVEHILSKNGFLSSYGRRAIPDTYGTTIPYQRLDVKDDRYFADYVERELVQRQELPRMSSGLIKKFRESVFEIFSNAVIHSQTKLGIFSCGQYFPNRNRIDFSVADLRIGIRRNVSVNAGLDLPPEKAIVWALEGRNTTKRGPIPGGLGLKLLREFITLNHGQVQIVSDSGYWCLRDGEEFSDHFDYPFPGTVVAIEIDTSDTHSYLLSSEVSESQIF